MSVGSALGSGRRARKLARLTRRSLAVATAVGCLTSFPLSAQRNRPPATARTGLTLAPIPFPSDSGLADQRAFETLPPPVREVLDVRRELQPQGGDSSLVCVPLSYTSDGSRRQRVQGKPYGFGLVVFARATKSGALARVEFVRRLADGSQRGYTWDAEGDATTAMEWAPGSTQAESHPVPRGGPIPRAVRGLGRIVLTWPCSAP